MNVKPLNVSLITAKLSAATCTTLNTQTTARIIPKHKKSFSNLNPLCIPPPLLSENRILTAMTPRKIAEADYKQRDKFDMGFYRSLEKSFKENLELQEKRLKIEERKRKQEEFTALKEARSQIKLYEVKRDMDDLNRQKEKLKAKETMECEKKKEEKAFRQEKRNSFIEFNYIRKRKEWESRTRLREGSAESLRVVQRADYGF
jgi:hypothetical protein